MKCKERNNCDLAIVSDMGFFVFFYASKYKTFLETAICIRLIITGKKAVGEKKPRFSQYTVPSSSSRHTKHNENKLHSDGTNVQDFNITLLTTTI